MFSLGFTTLLRADNESISLFLTTYQANCNQTSSSIVTELQLNKPVSQNRTLISMNNGASIIFHSDTRQAMMRHTSKDNSS